MCTVHNEECIVDFQLADVWFWFWLWFFAPVHRLQLSPFTYHYYYLRIVFAAFNSNTKMLCFFQVDFRFQRNQLRDRWNAHTISARSSRYLERAQLASTRMFSGTEFSIKSKPNQSPWQLHTRLVLLFGIHLFLFWVRVCGADFHRANKHGFVGYSECWKLTTHTPN